MAEETDGQGGEKPPSVKGLPVSAAIAPKAVGVTFPQRGVSLLPGALQCEVEVAFPNKASAVCSWPAFAENKGSSVLLASLRHHPVLPAMHALCFVSGAPDQEIRSL